MVRVRFAPSPTGFPHIGNIRTALFNWLFARNKNGTFILRIEDTDVQRKVEGAVEGIIESLKWLGLLWDEGPYFQSQRLELYRKEAQRLLDEGKAYLCFCSPERLERMREEQRKRGEPPKYDRKCRDLTEKERERLLKEGITPVIRFKTPLYGETKFQDFIRGEIRYKNEVLDDFVLLKSDGYPTYHLANVVDDHYMRITHVLRADEWLPSTPRHILLYEALGFEPPIFAHLPMILGPDRSKLSKRHGAVSILEYKEEGYLPEAMINFLALLGWSLDDKTEIISREELIKNFSLERISKTGAVFNIDKLRWMNGYYIRKMSDEELLERLMPFMEGIDDKPVSRDYLIKIIPLIKERIFTLREARDYSLFFFKDPSFEEELLYERGLDKERVLEVLEKSLETLIGVQNFTSKDIELSLRSLADEMGLKAGDLFWVLRVVITGRKASPPLFQTMEVLGKDTCIRRIKNGLYRLRG